MDNRARASLTYRILTDVLGLTLVLGAFSLSLITDYTVASLVRNVILYAIVFAVLILIWRRLGSMFDLGILGGKVSALVGMIIALNIALAPVFLKILISNNDEVRPFAAGFLAVSFGLVMLLLMFLVRRSHAYKTKAHWRLVHHSLLIMGGLFLLSLFMPLAIAPIAGIPGRFLIWALALVVMPILQRVGSGLVANPAQPHRTSSTPLTSSSSASASSSLNSSDHAVDEEKVSHEPHNRPPRRHGRGGGGGGRFRRHSGPSRRRM